MTIQAVIYDMDGVLIDSEPMWQKAEKMVFDQLGIQLSTSDCLQTKGMRIDEVVDYWYQVQPWENYKKTETIQAILDRLIDLIQSKGKAMAGVHESLDLFQQHNLPLAIATSSPSRVMDAILNTLDIRHRFKEWCSAEYELFGKPHPAVYLTAAQRLNIQPNRCLVIEDSVSGMVAAKAAKMQVIAIPEASEYDRSEWSLADFKLKSLNDLLDLKLF